MGVYVYTMRAKQCSKIGLEGKRITANLLAFAFKPYFWEDEQPASFKRIQTRAENFWEQRDRAQPNYFVIGDNFENGAEVRKGWPAHKGWCYDTPNFPGEHVGYLKKVGRGFRVVKNESECY